jgi:hypothetical protein
VRVCSISRYAGVVDPGAAGGQQSGLDDQQVGGLPFLVLDEHFRYRTHDLTVLRPHFTAGLPGLGGRFE